MNRAMLLDMIGKLSKPPAPMKLIVGVDDLYTTLRHFRQAGFIIRRDNPNKAKNFAYHIFWDGRQTATLYIDRYNSVPAGKMVKVPEIPSLLPGYISVGFEQPAPDLWLARIRFRQ